MKQERIMLLRQVLMQEKKVDCMDLCSRFDVSMATIRRDLEQLEKEGTIRRFYGGAELIESRSEPHLTEIVPEWNIREVSNVPEKCAIAREISRLIPDGSTVFLDGGTTVYELVKLLAGRSRLTVVTCSLRNASLLGMYPNIETYCLGGNIKTNMLIATGLLSTECLSFFPSIDYYVLSADGVTPYGGVREWSTEVAMLKKSIISRSKTIIAAIDHSKFGLSASSSLCQLKDIDYLVTGRELEQSTLAQLQERGVNVILAD